MFDLFVLNEIAQRRVASQFETRPMPRKAEAEPAPRRRVRPRTVSRVVARVQAVADR